LAQRQWNIPELRRLLEDILPRNTELRDYQVRLDFAASGKKTLLLNARRVARKSDGQAMILLAIREQT
jgi:two-component system CheB/CheR fusion protein